MTDQFPTEFGPKENEFSFLELYNFLQTKNPNNSLTRNIKRFFDLNLSITDAKLSIDLLDEAIKLREHESIVGYDACIDKAIIFLSRIFHTRNKGRLHQGLPSEIPIHLTEIANFIAIARDNALAHHGLGQTANNVFKDDIFMDENLRYRAVFRRKGIAGDTEIIAMKELANYIINIISEKMDFMAKNDLYNAVVQNRNIFDAALKAIKAD